MSGLLHMLNDEKGYVGEPVVNHMSCDERVRLATVYEAAAAKFAEAVKELQQKIDISAKQERNRKAQPALGLDEFLTNSDGCRVCGGD